MKFSKCLVIASLGLSFASSAFATSIEFMERKLESVSGLISKVEMKAAPAPATGLWTEITVEFGVSCDEQFENFSYSADHNSSGKLEIVASAVISKPAITPDLSCAGFFMHEEIITVDGMYTPDLVAIKFMPFLEAMAPQSLVYSTENLEKIAAIDDVKVEAVTELCPKDAICITNGTIVTLSTLIPCVDKVAGISYNTYQNGDKLVIELFGAQVVSALKVRCAEMPFKFSVTAIMDFADSVDKVEVKLLQ